MNKHTPGPWMAHGLAIYTKDKRPNWVMSRDSRESLIADVRDHEDENSSFQDNPPSLAEAESNARLIASAPELLEALEALLYSAESLRDDCESHDGICGEPASFHQARAVIAKAKGEA